MARKDGSRVRFGKRVTTGQQLLNRPNQLDYIPYLHVEGGKYLAMRETADNVYVMGTYDTEYEAIQAWPELTQDPPSIYGERKFGSATGREVLDQ